MNPKTIRWLVFVLSIAALAGFIAVYWKLLSTEWAKPPGPNMEFLASSLAGLVGGIVAAAFGQKLPDRSESDRAKSLVIRRLNSFGRFISPFERDPPREVLATAYALAYVGMSIWAIVVWAQDAPNTPKLTSHLAVVAMGLFVATVSAYLSDSDGGQE